MSSELRDAINRRIAHFDRHPTHVRVGASTLADWMGASMTFDGGGAVTSICGLTPIVDATLAHGVFWLTEGQTTVVVAPTMRRAEFEAARRGGMAKPMAAGTLDRLRGMSRVEILVHEPLQMHQEIIMSLKTLAQFRDNIVMFVIP